MVCSLRSHTLPLQYISPLSIFASPLLMMLQRFGIICLMMYVQPLLSTHSERSSKPISLHKHIQPNISFFRFLSMAPTLAMSQACDYSSLLFWFGAPRVWLYMEIKRYKNTIRIRISKPMGKGCFMIPSVLVDHAKIETHHFSMEKCNWTLKRLQVMHSCGNPRLFKMVICAILMMNSDNKHNKMIDPVKKEVN